MRLAKLAGGKADSETFAVLKRPVGEITRRLTKRLDRCTQGSFLNLRATGGLEMRRGVSEPAEYHHSLAATPHMEPTVGAAPGVGPAESPDAPKAPRRSALGSVSV